jgi:hypothetical protein
MPCVFCGEYHPATFARRAKRICANCYHAANPHRLHGTCTVCGQWQPIDDHHVYGATVSNETVPLCVNCHRKLHSYLRINYAPANPIMSMLYRAHRGVAGKQGWWQGTPPNMARRNSG